MVNGYPCIESMTSLELYLGPKEGRWHVRVWRSEKEVLDDYDNNDVGVLCHTRVWTSRRELAIALTNLPRVSAVEVDDQNGNGVILYVEWP